MNISHREKLRTAERSSVALSSAKPSATLVRVSDGVQVIRDGEAFLADSGEALKLGDGLVVPDEGWAHAVFQEQGGQSILGIFDGGTHAALVYFSRKSGACSVVFDVHRGRVDLSLSSQGESTDGVIPSRRVLGLHCYSKPLSVS